MLSWRNICWQREKVMGQCFVDNSAEIPSCSFSSILPPVQFLMLNLLLKSLFFCPLPNKLLNSTVIPSSVLCDQFRALFFFYTNEGAEEGSLKQCYRRTTLTSCQMSTFRDPGACSFNIFNSASRIAAKQYAYPCWVIKGCSRVPQWCPGQSWHLSLQITNTTPLPPGHLYYHLLYKRYYIVLYSKRRPSSISTS